jgi:hypothetical protein
MLHAVANFGVTKGTFSADLGGQRVATSTRILELAFPHDALERLVRIFDAILIIGPVRGKKLHDLIGAVGGHMPDRAGREVDGLTDLKLVFFQRDSPELELHHSALGRAMLPPIGAQYSSEIDNCLKNSTIASRSASALTRYGINNIINVLRL